MKIPHNFSWGSSEADLNFQEPTRLNAAIPLPFYILAVGEFKFAIVSEAARNW